MRASLGVVFYMQSAPIVTSCNGRRTIGSGVLCGYVLGLCLENRNTAEYRGYRGSREVESLGSADRLRQSPLAEAWEA
jgi:hypothetical protein